MEERERFMQRPEVEERWKAEVRLHSLRETVQAWYFSGSTAKNLTDAQIELYNKATQAIGAIEEEMTNDPLYLVPQERMEEAERLSQDFLNSVEIQGDEGQ